MSDRSARDLLAEELAAFLWCMQDRDRLADVIVSRLSEEGWVVVPREPTSEMVRAGDVADMSWQERDDDSSEVVCIYRAMLAAI